jgi:hypothetical protein
VAAIVVWSAVLAGLVVASVRRGALPLGALTIGLLVAAVPAGLATNEPRVIAAALVAGLVGDLVVRLARPGPGRPRAIWLLGTALPATWAIAYLVAVVNTTGSGLSVHALAGAATLAGLTGLLLAIVATRERRPAPA